jgi:hypothetical protein
MSLEHPTIFEVLMPAEALQSANITCAHESYLVIQLKPSTKLKSITSDSE